MPFPLNRNRAQAQAAKKPQGPWALRVFLVGLACYGGALLGGPDRLLALGWMIELLAVLLYTLRW